MMEAFKKYPSPDAAQDAMKHFYGCCVFTGRLWIKNDREGGVHFDGMHIFPRKAFPELSCYAINNTINSPSSVPAIVLHAVTDNGGDLS